MKSTPTVVWEGDTLTVVRDMSAETRRAFGTELRNLQKGAPVDVKPMPTVGPGVREIRVWAADGTYRAFFVHLVKETIHVLHVFKKKSQQTPQKDIDKGKVRLKGLKERLRG